MMVTQQPNPSQTRLYPILDKLPAGAYTCDAEGLITYFNQRAVELWGRSPQLNHPIDRFCGSFRLFSTTGVPIPHDQCWMALALRDAREYNGMEIVIERPDGSRWIALAHANPLFDADGILLGAVNVLVDITDRKQAEEMLREADRQKSEFLAMLGHELRNPLNPIRNAVKVMQLKGSLDPELEWCRSVIERQVVHLSRLLDDLLDLSRIARDKLTLHPQRVELGRVLHEAIETSRPLIDQQGHDLSIHLPAEPIYLQADNVRLSQVFVNLLNNAAKFTPPGGRIVLAARREGDVGVVSVRDCGVGIDLEQLAHLFEMFYQAEGSTHDVQGGLGIGLSLVSRLVEMHGGTVTAQSDGVGHGSEFIVRLPILAEATPLPEPANRNGHAPATPHRILIVDDQRDAARSLAMLLNLTGNKTEIAHDGLEALEVARAFRPEIVLLDIGLPKLDGHEVARRLRQEPRGSEMMLIAVTGWGQEEDRRLSHAAGFDHHLVKPVDYEALLDLLVTVKPSPACSP